MIGGRHGCAVAVKSSGARALSALGDNQNNRSPQHRQDGGRGKTTYVRRRSQTTSAEGLLESYGWSTGNGAHRPQDEWRLGDEILEAAGRHRWHQLAEQDNYSTSR